MHQLTLSQSTFKKNIFSIVNKHICQLFLKFLQLQWRRCDYFISLIILLLRRMASSIKKRIETYRALGTSTSILTHRGIQPNKHRYFQQGSQNRCKPIVIKSFVKQKQQEKTTSTSTKSRCRTFLNQSLDVKNRKERTSAPLNKHQKQLEGTPKSPKRELEIDELIKCKQLLKTSDRIHKDRWRLLTSIQTKLLQELQSNIFKKQQNRARGQDPQLKHTFQMNNLVKFTDLMRIKQVQIQKEGQITDRMKRKLYTNSIKKKAAVLSRTQPSFGNPDPVTKNSTLRDPWKHCSHIFGHLSIREQDLTGWETGADI